MLENLLCEVFLVMYSTVQYRNIRRVELDSGIPKFNGVMSWSEKKWWVGRDINAGSGG